jgi:hypothetical protein
VIEFEIKNISGAFEAHVYDALINFQHKQLSEDKMASPHPRGMDVEERISLHEPFRLPVCISYTEGFL